MCTHFSEVARREAKRPLGYARDGENFHRGHSAYETPPESAMAAALLGLFFFSPHRFIDSHCSDLGVFDHKLTLQLPPPHLLSHNVRLVTRIVSVVTKLDCCVSLPKSQAVSFFSMGPKSGAGIQKNRSSRGRCRYSPNIFCRSLHLETVPRWLVGHSLVAR